MNSDASRQRAEEALSIDARELIAGLMVQAGVQQNPRGYRRISERIGKSARWVRDRMSDRAAMSVRDVAAMAWALGFELKLNVRPVIQREPVAGGLLGGG